MHPHVVISGIASLLPKDDAAGKSESELNDHPQINIVDENVTDNWEAVKRGENGNYWAYLRFNVWHPLITPSVQGNSSSRPSNSALQQPGSGSSPVRSRSGSSFSDDWEAFKGNSQGTAIFARVLRTLIIGSVSNQQLPRIHDLSYHPPHPCALRPHLHTDHNHLLSIMPEHLSLLMPIIQS
jgi:hypothetical protein